MKQLCAGGARSRTRTLLGVVIAWSYCVCSVTDALPSLSYVPFMRNAPNIISSHVLNNPAFVDFCTGNTTPLVCIPNALSLDLIQNLKLDALALAATGFGASAGVAGATTHNSLQTDTIRRNVLQIWLQSPSSPGLQGLVGVGDLHARTQLLQFVHELRCSLAPRVVPSLSNDSGEHYFDDGAAAAAAAAASLPSDLVELSYLLYEPGSYYQRHLDVIVQSHQPTSRRRRRRRVISLILFLGGKDTVDSSSSQPWDIIENGGALRIHSNPFAQYTGHAVNVVSSSSSSLLPAIQHYSDVPPTAGTLLLFDSATVPHEVLETRRHRMCVVGWFSVPN
jgi:hypothetical protein